VENIGAEASSGTITIRNMLPVGVTAHEIEFEPELEGECKPQGQHEVICETSKPVVPTGFIVININFTVTGAVGVGSLMDVTSVSGDGSSAVDETDINVTAKPQATPAALRVFKVEGTGPAGEPATQAGGHPYLLTTTLLLNTVLEEGIGAQRKPAQPLKDLVFYLPIGLLGNPTVVSTCPVADVEPAFDTTDCPSSSRLGTVLAMVTNNVVADYFDATHEPGIYNVPPEKGYVAEFAFGSSGFTFVLYASLVRHDGRYMVRVSVPGLPPVSEFVGAVTSFYGDIEERNGEVEGEHIFDRGAFLTDPSNCSETSEEGEMSVEANTWANPSLGFPLKAAADTFPKLEHCELQPFSADLAITPENAQAEAPSGYQFGLDVAQQPNVGSAIAAPPLRDVSVTLPAGTTISPPGANGIQACQATGPQGINIEGPESEAIGADGLEHPVAGKCPFASRLGAVTAKSPLLQEPFAGHLFLAEPECKGEGPEKCTPEDAEDGKLFKLYMELEAPERGVIIKLAGKATVNVKTGQITASFDENPQFPVSELNVTLTQGPRAPLANPATCGPATSQGNLTSWSPETPALQLASTFDVSWDGIGAACPQSSPFAPAFKAFASPDGAGASGSLTIRVNREDREQNLRSLSVTLPKGLLANVARVGRCSKALASRDELNACPESSQIATVTASVGAGSEPYWVTGKAYLTESYERPASTGKPAVSAPFGLTVIVPAVAGPFNLGNVLVRAVVTVNPETAQVTVESEPLPEMIDGVPIHIRTLNITVDAGEFMLNPTSCGRQQITATLSSTIGATSALSSPFTTSGCKYLGFKPTLAVTTEALSTKLDGTGVDVKITSPTNHEANLSRLVLSFPKRLPVRLSTLRKACPEATFNVNPAACPSASDVGRAIVHTPILGLPLTGAAYLVSHGSAQFPDVVFVLQGEGVEIDLVTKSSVSASGVLTSSSETIPDAPFSSVEATFSKGENSVFTSTKTTTAARASQCGEGLVAPAKMTAQNDARLKLSPHLTVAGCPLKVSVLRAQLVQGALRVTVRASQAGTLRLTGGGIEPLAKHISAGTHTLRLHLSATGRAAIRAHRSVELTAKLTAGRHKAHARRRIGM